MNLQKNTVIFSLIALVFSFLIAIALHYCSYNHPHPDEWNFWSSVFMGIMGSLLVTLLLSIVSYLSERKNTLEKFEIETRAILRHLFRYQVDWSLERKMTFWIDYHNMSKKSWEMAFYDISFLCDLKNKNQEYITNKIVQPIVIFNNYITNVAFHFEQYLDGRIKNEIAMKHYINEIENKIIEKIFKQSGFGTCTQYNNRFVRDLLYELNGKYRMIMYRKVGDYINATSKTNIP